MAKRTSVCVWFIEPRDENTDHALSREIDEEVAHRYLLCADGKRRDLWEVNSDLLQKFIKSKVSSNYKFSVWRRIGGGKIQPANFLSRRKKILQARKNLNKPIPKAPKVT